MDDSFSPGHSRMDWGFGNPNKTAALIALLMMAVWGLAYIRKWGFWPALALFTGFGVCLILTQSRGGLVGVIIGALILLAWVPRPFLFRRSFAVIGACVTLAVFAWQTNTESRYTQGLSSRDRSIDNRLLIWRQVPAMIHDAPHGWGLGKSGDAYMQWYQPITRGEGYRTLVNSHLTWLVELGWWGRITYVFAWAAVFVLLWPRADYRWFSIPWAVWMSFAICAAFSSVAEALVLWLVPILTLVTVLAIRLKRNLWPALSHWLVGALFAVVLLGAIFLLGMQAGRPFIYSPDAGTVILGQPDPKIWIIAPNRDVLGEHYGHEVRRGLATQSVFQRMGIGIERTAEATPKDRILIFSGETPPLLAEVVPSQVILINPSPPSAAPLKVLVAQPNVTVIVGEYSRNKGFWNEQAQSHPNIKVQLVTGAEEFISNWMLEVAKAIRN
jgi:hypothetical protein